MGRADLVEALRRSGEPDRAARSSAATWSDAGAPRRTRSPVALVARRGAWSPRGERALAAEAAAITAFRRGGRPVRGGADPAAARRAAAPGALRSSAARHELRLGGSAFERMGAGRGRRARSAELRATRARIPAPDIPTPASDPWRPSPRRSAAWPRPWRRGASDRQVAAELFLSPRTVAYHLASVYRKLGVSTGRTALAARLAHARDAPDSRSGGSRVGVDHGQGRARQVVPELGLVLGGHPTRRGGLVEGCAHVAQPGVVGGGIDRVRRVPHPQARVPPLLGVGGRPTPVLLEEQLQALAPRARGRPRGTSPAASGPTATPA